jgi:hypothetical protein
MPVYAVYEPPTRNRSPAELADRAVFVRDGFSFAAFVFGALWMIWRRLWLTLLIYVVAVGALEYALARLGVGIGARVGVFLLVAFLIGMEAATLRRWTLLRRGWRDCGVVIAGDRELAERRFFDVRQARKAAVAASGGSANTPYVPAALYSSTGPGVIGLFPEPGGGG